MKSPHSIHVSGFQPVFNYFSQALKVQMLFKYSRVFGMSQAGSTYKINANTLPGAGKEKSRLKRKADLGRRGEYFPNGI